MAPSAGALRVGRYFLALLGLFVVLYAIVAWPHQPKTPKLGLDLEGGAQVILKAQTSNGKAPSKSSLNQARQIITNRVNGLGVSSAEVVTQGNDRIVVSVPGASANDIKDVGGTALLQFRPLLPIYDSSGQQNQSIPVDCTTTGSSSASASASSTAGASASGSATATSSASAKPASSAASAKPASSAASAKPASSSPAAAGAATPAASSAESAAAGSASRLAAAGTTSASKATTPAASTTPKASSSASPSASSNPACDAATNPFLKSQTQPEDQWKIVGFTPPTTPEAIQALLTSNPTEIQALYAAIEYWPCNSTAKPLDEPTKPIITCDEANQNKYLLGPVIVPGTEVKSASAIAPGSVQGQFQWTVNVDLKPTGQAKWADYTSKHNEQANAGDIANVVADTLDSKVIVASTIQSTINGTTQITGNFDQDSATNLANSLKYGALPLNFVQQAATSISPTLGTSQLKAGMLAGGIGLLLVVIYSLIYYRALGLVTIASLVVSGGLTYAMLVILGKQIGFTLTLAGIAGFIVAVGITADSFVVFFERIKDEVHEGRSARVAIPRAWNRAKRTILSADMVSFLAAFILYLFAAGDVKGFAFTLGLSTILDLVVVFLFTHPLVSLFSRSAAFGSARFTGLSNVRAGGVSLVDEPLAAEGELVTVGAPAEPEPEAAGPVQPPVRQARPQPRNRRLSRPGADAPPEELPSTRRADAEPDADQSTEPDADRAAQPEAEPGAERRSRPPRSGGPSRRPASGATAAERAAARRGRTRLDNDTIETGDEDQ